MDLFIIDTIGPFFKGYNRHRYNWSKVPFDNLERRNGRLHTGRISMVRRDFRRLIRKVSALGYNAISIDDLAHLVSHPAYNNQLQAKISDYRAFYRQLFDYSSSCGMGIFVNSDIMFYNHCLEEKVGRSVKGIANFLKDAIDQLFVDFPSVDGIIFRIGESDARDVDSEFRSKLVIRNSEQVRRLLQILLPVFESHGKLLVFRTWTVGAYRIGDLIWNRNTFRNAFANIASPNLVLSMKYGESDFFSYLPLNKHFFRTKHKLIMELQTRREYEGFGEIPVFVGWDYHAYAEQIRNQANVIGISVWCQTGGWSTFRRITYLKQSSIWTELNTFVTLKLFKDAVSVEDAIEAYQCSFLEHCDLNKLIILLHLADEVIKDLLYIDDFARQKLFFRRLRLPPLLAVYWDYIIVNHSLRKILRCFVTDGAKTIEQGYMALKKIVLMQSLAADLQLPTDTIEFEYDTFRILAAAREYYFGKHPMNVKEKLESLKSEYYRKYDSHYTVMLDFSSFPVSRRKMKLLFSIFFRKQRGYRLFDRVFLISLLSLLMPILKHSSRLIVPDYLQDHAMGIDTLFK